MKTRSPAPLIARSDPLCRAARKKESSVACQASPRGGVVGVEVAGDRVLLGGQAVTVLRGELVDGQADGAGSRYTNAVAFRDRLVATLRAVAPVLEEPGVLIVGSEVPNLLEPGVAATLVVSQDVDVGVPVERHAAVKRRLDALRGLRQSPEERSVWVPDDPGLLEVNFVGMDSRRDPMDTSLLEDERLPLLVFGPLALLQPAEPVSVEGLRVPVPRPAGLTLEKLVTDRTGEKGERDLLVALGLLMLARPQDMDELVATYRTLSPELRHTVCSNLTVLSLMKAHAQMPDPEMERARVAALLARLDAAQKAAT